MSLTRTFLRVSCLKQCPSKLSTALYYSGCAGIFVKQHCERRNVALQQHFRKLSVSLYRFNEQKMSDNDPESPKEECSEEEARREENINDIKDTILDHALDYVNEYGWTRKTISLGAEAAGYSAVAEGMFKHEGADLVIHFVKHCNDRLQHYLEEKVKNIEENSEKLRKGDFIRDALKFRLRLIIPYIEKWPEAMTLLLSPSALNEGTGQLCRMVDDIWYHAGDRSTDINWYTKRGMLTKLYISTQLYMIKDESPDFADTWEFLERRLNDLAMFGKVTRGLKETCDGFYDVVVAGSTMIRNIAGFPDKHR